MSRGGRSKPKGSVGAGMPSAPERAGTSRSGRPTAGTRVVAALREGIDAMRAEGPDVPAVPVRTYRLGATPLPELGPAGAKAARAGLGLSQSAFADFLGVSVGTVRAWEQGKREPSPMARRFLGEIRRDPDHWRRAVRARLAEDAGAPIAGGPTPPR